MKINAKNHREFPKMRNNALALHVIIKRCEIIFAIRTTSNSKNNQKSANNEKKNNKIIAENHRNSPNITEIRQYCRS